jgi:DNA polymerase I
MRRFVIVDTMYLCHRARHSTGGLSFDGQSTGVLYGVLRDIDDLQRRLKPDAFIFTFDSKHSFRKRLSETYKSNREPRPDDDAFRAEVSRLATEILPALNFTNVYQAHGYEADDIIASFAFSVKEGDQALICSRDEDLYQLLRPNVGMYKVSTSKVPAHIYTDKRFEEEYGIPPSLWAHVKALAGCSSDVVEGVPGIGEKYAIRWILKDLDKGKKFEALRDHAGEALDRNLPLVQLPFKHESPLPSFDNANIAEHGNNRPMWLTVNDLLGIRRDPRVSEERKEEARAKRNSFV